MTAAEIALKSPSVALFQKGKFLDSGLTLWKRGVGEIFGWIWGSFGELLGLDTNNQRVGLRSCI